MLAGGGASLAAFALLRTLDRQSERAAFGPQAALVTAALQRGIDRQLEGLGAVEGLFDASERVERAEFDLFADRILRLAPALSALGWAPRVEADNREAFVRAMRADGAPDFEIVALDGAGRPAPAPPSPASFPLAYLERRDGGQSGLGLDLGSLPAFAPLLTADGRGQAATATRVGSLAALPGAASWMVLLLPRSIDSPASADHWILQRSPGFIVGAVDAAALIEGALEKFDLRDLAVEVAELSPADEARVLYRAGLPTGPGEDDLVWLDRVEVADRPWRVRVYVSLGSAMRRASWRPWAALGLGLLFTGGLAGGLAVSAGRTRTIELLVAERTEALAAANAALAADIGRRRAVEAELRRLGAELERRVDERTRELRAAYAELESFSYSASHDLRGPLRTLSGLSEVLLEDYGDRLDDEGRDYLVRIRTSAERLAEAIEAMLEMSRTVRGGLHVETVDLGALAHEVAAELRAAHPDRALEFSIAGDLRVRGDPRLLRALLVNQLGNACKFTVDRDPARIEVGGRRLDGEVECFVRDNGLGFDLRDAERVFQPFQRLHDAERFEGSGIGLATARRIVRRHLGRVWAEAAPDQGATFYFTLPAA